MGMGPGLLATSVVMTWVYNHTRRSILGAILLHFTMNFWGEFLHLPGHYKGYQFFGVVLIALLIVILAEPARFTGLKKKRQAPQ
jgi:membrane protease YdiL (CAAX protease family)